MPTLCFTGMDRNEEARLKQLFSDANARLGGEWNLVAEAQAKVVIVDMESIYGHMTWLKTQSSGKYIIGISSRPESEAEHVLARAVTADSLAEALRQASGGGHVPNRAAITMKLRAAFSPVSTTPASAQ